MSGKAVVATQLRAAIEDEANVRRGSAHVEADHSVEVQIVGDPGGRGNARRGPGEGEAEWAFAKCFGRNHSTRGVEQVQMAVRWLGLCELAEIGCDKGHDAGVEHRRNRAFEFTCFGIDTMCERDVRRQVAGAVAEAFFMARVGVAMNQADRQGFGPQCRGVCQSGGGAGLIERLLDHTLVGDALIDFEAPLGGNQRLGLGRQVEAVELAAVLTADLEGIGKPDRAQQDDPGEPILDDGIGHQGGSVDQIRDALPG